MAHSRWPNERISTWGSAEPTLQISPSGTIDGTCVSLPGCREGPLWGGAFPGAGHVLRSTELCHEAADCISSYYGKNFADKPECLEVRSSEMLHGGCFVGVQAEAGAWACILGTTDTPGTRATLL